MFPMSMTLVEKLETGTVVLFIPTASNFNSNVSVEFASSSNFPLASAATRLNGAAGILLLETEMVEKGTDSPEIESITVPLRIKKLLFELF